MSVACHRACRARDHRGDLPRAVLQVPKIEFIDRAELEDLKPVQKTPIQKMQESLDKVGSLNDF